MKKKSTAVEQVLKLLEEPPSFREKAEVVSQSLKDSMKILEQKFPR